MKPTDKPPRGPLLIDEEVRIIGEADPNAPTNPYWDDQHEPHPNPELGCIRRGLCCKSNPGWFAPGEVEQAAQSLNMDPDEFVRTHLVVDWLEDPEGNKTYVFAPAKLGRDNKPLEPTGANVSRLYGLLKGPCIFYTHAQRACLIYKARPSECRQYICTENAFHRPAIAALWKA